ncbi:MAG: CDP-diacylglycerol--glycerol-3-phosphate 3-phosphatidyltransferase [Erysipelotrichaceae bacterium]|nr:CDP-diacylglycerol--glycerol-3-phosphate 3-phosphatidyltransferase [Erysipelotrichaceae bacterium]
MNLPNRLTLLRIFFVPLIVFVFVFPFAQYGIVFGHIAVGFVTLPIVNLIALGLFALASITDFFDGYLARKNHQISTFGKFMDPIADKLLVNTMFILFAIQGLIPVIAVLVMIWRDVFVDGLRMLAAEKGRVVSAGYMGKLKTVVQMLTIMLILVSNLPFELYNLPVSNFLLWFSVVVSIISGVGYFRQLSSLVLESK